MTRQRYDDALQDIVRPEVEALGFSLWGIDVASAGSKALVRIYIDADNGVSIDDCAAVSRQVGTVLEVEDIMHGAYVLEVSSPGLERRFFDAGQMLPYLGRTVIVRLHEAREDVKKFSGKLAAVDGDVVVLESDGDEIRFDWDQIKKTTLVHDF